MHSYNLSISRGVDNKLIGSLANKEDSDGAIFLPTQWLEVKNTYLKKIDINHEDQGLIRNMSIDATMFRVHGMGIS